MISLKKIILVKMLFIICAYPQAGLNCDINYFKSSNFSEKVLRFDENWYGGKDARLIANNMLLYQLDNGGWPKNIDYSKRMSNDELNQLFKKKPTMRSTIDNGATYVQLHFLSKVIESAPEEKYIISFNKGVKYLLDAQYENGGWGQYFPPRDGYYSHITYNDDAMAGVLRILYAVSRGEFDFIDDDLKSQASVAVEMGVECILNTQVEIDGNLTAWCAQHDETTLEPVKGRAYELPSLSGKETTGILLFLMEIDDPSPDVCFAIQSAVKWLETVSLEGIRMERYKDSTSPTGFNKIIVEDVNAPPIWARFYHLQTMNPIYSDRDGKIYNEMADISSERRNEYAWLGYWPQEIINCYHSTWKNIHADCLEN